MKSKRQASKLLGSS